MPSPYPRRVSIASPCREGDPSIARSFQILPDIHGRSRHVPPRAKAAGASFALSASTVVEDFQQFVDLGLTIALVAGMKGVRYAVLKVIAQDLLLDTVQRCTHGADLRQHIDAVAVFLDHAGDAADLALDAAEPGKL
jgi:hypothetical protein